MERILSALEYLEVSNLSYADWITVGMALKAEGFPCSDWEAWSRNDARYHSGECEEKWKSFKGSGKPVTGGTIIQMAMEQGWEPLSGEDGCMDWNDPIEYDGYESHSGLAGTEKWVPTDDLLAYLEALYEPGDCVGYCTTDSWEDNADGKWKPRKGVYDRTAGELITQLKKHPDDIGATVGDWKPEAGAWIRFNPLDGRGVKNENVTGFKYALVESDEISIEEQEAIYRKLELPVAAIVNSGHKSLHAIVRVDASDMDEYYERVDTLYDFLEENGLSVDRQNKNPSRYSRMPGATRNGNRQYLVATNIGCKSWNEWMGAVENVSDGLPEIVSLSDYKDNPPPVPEELIKGILRGGHKMLISGASKAGKSFLLMELCVAIAEGVRWLGFPCRKGRVLYVNLEIDKNSAINRFLNIYKELGLEEKNIQNIEIWNLRGHAVPLNELEPKLIRRVRDKQYDAIIFDPIYKIITGDENSATAMGAFCNEFDKICTEAGCATIYCHHHSKGEQGQKRAMDRASGSGVFARDPDALLDIIELKVPEEIKASARDRKATAWRLESCLREFANITPVNFWFEYPVHRVDESGVLEKCCGEGSREANLTKSNKRTSREQRKDALDDAFEACSEDGVAKLADMVKYINRSEKCVRNYIKEFEKYECKSGEVTKKEIGK